jgi:hypothetical protein
MKRGLVFLLLLFFPTFVVRIQKVRMLTFMTFNIRHDHHEDSPTSPFAEAPVKEDPFDPSQFALEQPWALRKWKVVDTILLYSPDILALQVKR